MKIHVFIVLDDLVSASVAGAGGYTDARARAVVRRVEALRAALPGAVPHMVASRAMHASLERVAAAAAAADSAAAPPWLARVHASSRPDRALLGRYVDALAEDARSGTMTAIVVTQRARGDGPAALLPLAVRYHTPDARLAAGRLLYARVMEGDTGVIVEDASRFPLAFERRADLDAFMSALQALRRRSRSR